MFLPPMFSGDTSIHATKEQLELLAGPRTINSLKTADFLGDQPYIDQWVRFWLTTNAWQPIELPLCVTESIICDKKLYRKYKKNVQQRVVQNDVEWLHCHYIVACNKIWNVVNFVTVPIYMFELLWIHAPIPLALCPFVAHSQQLSMWRTFVDKYGPEVCIEDAAKQQWYDGVEYCVEQGCEVKDVVKHCVRSSRLFRLVTLCNPEATQEAWGEFCLQRQLSRVEDVALVEEWFFVHGFRSEN